MARDKAYREAENRIDEARQSGATKLTLSNMGLTELPESLGQLTQLQALDLSGNELTTLPMWLGQLAQLEYLSVNDLQLTSLPEWIAQLIQLKVIDIMNNQISELPEWLGDLPRLNDIGIGDATGGNPLRQLPFCLIRLKQLRELWVMKSQLKAIPEWLGKLTSLRALRLDHNRITDLPASLAELEQLQQISLNNNPLNPELAAASAEGLDAVMRYLHAKAGAPIVLNEAKLILVGEGEVGKSCLLDALRGDPWSEHDSTHGIEIRPVKVKDPDSDREITLNGWDFGGQRVYRPTHQLFFSAPAVYLVVWKPREGPEQGFVKDWIRLVKHREPEAKILVVATHGGPGQRQPDLNRQEFWELFGHDTVLEFFHVDSKPNDKGERRGVAELKESIARVAASLPEMGRTVPARWQQAREALKQTGAAYLPLEQVLDICREHKMDDDEARLFVSISHRLGHLIHYEHDPSLRDIVVLKPDWLATAISFVLDDEETRKAHGLVSFARLSHLWNDPKRDVEFRYDPKLHPVFLRLMERFDLSYRVAGLHDEGQQDRTSLIAQLVPDIRPKLDAAWPANVTDGYAQQVQICRIVENTERGHSASAEGLFYRLIVRLHKYSLGRASYEKSVHWQRGLVLDDDYNGRALLEHVGNDIRITVRAPYPEAFLSVLTREVKWLVEEDIWAGLRCDVMVPCIEPCGKRAPGTGLYEVQKLIESKRQRRLEYPCPVCTNWQVIDSLLRNAPAARPNPLSELLENSADVMLELEKARLQLRAQPLDGRQYGMLQDALLAAFPTLNELEMMLKIRLNWELNKIAGGNNNLEVVVFNLIRWADARGEISRLFQAARIANPGNPQLAHLTLEFDWAQTEIKPVVGRFDKLDTSSRELISKVEASYTNLLQALVDEAKEGPRLFSFEPINPDFFSRPNWAREKFRFTLWCEHSRMPLPALNGEKDRRGVYELTLAREWFVNAAPFFKVINTTLGLVLPVASSATKLLMDDASYTRIQKELELGQRSIDSVFKEGKMLGRWLGRNDSLEPEHGESIRAQGLVLRDLHVTWKEHDPKFAGLVRVQNKRQEFLWVHPQFEKEY